MVEISNITKKYGKREILKGISFFAGPGECICITGRNGSGKTTLLRIIAGALRADCGEISFFGNMTGAGRKNHNDLYYRKYSGYVPQTDPLMEELSVKDNLFLFGADRQMAEYACQKFELNDILNQRVSKLSGGMKRRLSVALALMKRPPLLVMDEPTAALDIYYKKDINKELENHLNGGGMIIMVSHDPDEIASASKVYTLEDGILCS